MPRLCTTVANCFSIEALESRRLFSAVRIMPLGDSITESFAPRESYRYWLWNSLQNAGFKNIDFVGSMHGVNGGAPSDPNFDQDHEGHSGWTAGGILEALPAWANSYRPDLVLLHLGTNDIRDGVSIDTTLGYLSSIIDVLREANPRVTVLLCQIIPNSDAPGRTQQLDAAIPGLAASKNQADSRVIVVDQATGFDLNADTFDGLHPNQQGEQKMSSRFLDVLRTVLPNSTPPVKSNTTFLSKLPSSSAVSGDGDVGMDRSSDGAAIELNGQVYGHGLGVTSDSRIDYKLNGKQRYFAADIGVDDEVGGAGSVVFKVYADGKRIFCSNIIKGNDSLVSLLLNIHGVKRLTLIVNNGGDNYNYDHADWGNARLIV